MNDDPKKCDRCGRMEMFKCVCGAILDDVCGPDAQAFTNEDFKFDEEGLENCGRGIMECENCGALAIEDPIDSCYVKFYVPENGKFNALFKGK